MTVSNLVIGAVSLEMRQVGFESDHFSGGISQAPDTLATLALSTDFTPSDYVCFAISYPRITSSTTLRSSQP
jgi:hypothetical protein